MMYFVCFIILVLYILHIRELGAIIYLFFFTNKQCSTYLWRYLFEAGAPLKKKKKEENKADKKVQELHEFDLEGEYYHINID